MAVDVDSRVAEMKSYRSCPATCQPVRRRRLCVAGVSVMSCSIPRRA
jgi:hypothetical protein